MRSDYQMPHMGGATIANKLTAILIEELRVGEFSECEKLPSEVELAAKYKVSRSVIRDVLANLERECIVERVRGLGTMVHREIINLQSRLDLKFEYNDLIRAAGSKPSVDSVKLYEKSADEELAERLGIDVGSPLVVCEKRILASGVPVIYSIDHLPQSLFGTKAWNLFDWSAPVFDLLEHHCGIVVDTDITNITAVCGSESIREKLQTAQGEALILMDEISCYKLTKPILQTYAFYTDFFDFTILRRKF